MYTWSVYQHRAYARSIVVEICKLLCKMLFLCFCITVLNSFYVSFLFQCQIPFYQSSLPCSFLPLQNLFYFLLRAVGMLSLPSSLYFCQCHNSPPPTHTHSPLAFLLRIVLFPHSLIVDSPEWLVK